MSEPEAVEAPTTPRKRGRPPKAPATPTPAKFVIGIYVNKNLTVVFRGKKRVIDEVAASDSDGSFIARYFSMTSSRCILWLTSKSPVPFVTVQRSPA